MLKSIGSEATTGQSLGMFISQKLFQQITIRRDTIPNLGTNLNNIPTSMHCVESLRMNLRPVSWIHWQQKQETKTSKKTKKKNTEA